MADAEPSTSGVQKAKKKPSFLEMAKEAVKELADKKGASVSAIQGYIELKYSIDTETSRHHLKTALAKGLSSEIFVRPKGAEDTKGFVGRFKINKLKEKEERKEKAKKLKAKEKEKEAKVKATEKSKTKKTSSESKTKKKADGIETSPKKKATAKATPKKKVVAKATPKKKATVKATPKKKATVVEKRTIKTKKAAMEKGKIPQTPVKVATLKSTLKTPKGTPKAQKARRR